MRTAILAAMLWCAASAAHAAGTKLLRFPDIWHDRIVFSYAGDLWTVDAGGGTAARLTSGPGLKLFGKYSPDGRYIAFTGQYGGDEQVYVMPAEGGVPRQLTFYPAVGPLPDRWGYDNQVYGWTPDGASILFRSLRDARNSSASRLYTVPRTGGAATALPMPQSGAGDFSPDGKKIVYSPQWRDFRSEKRYQGGWANVLYIFDLQHTSWLRLSDEPHAARDPMWIGGAVYFNSDRSGVFNLYRYDIASRQIEQVTHYRDWDVRWPSADTQGRIVFESNGELHVYDTQSAEDRALTITVPSDLVSERTRQVNAADHIESHTLSPGGERVAVVARGDVFSMPVEFGVTRNLTHSSNAHEREASWSSDGRRVVYVSDLSGEEEIYVQEQSGNRSAVQISSNSSSRYFAPRLSGDDQHIAVGANDRAHSPAFSPDGKFLYFLSEREFEPILSTVEFNFATDRQTGVFALALTKASANPVAIHDDEPGDAHDADEEPDERADKSKPLHIEFDGIEARAIRVPVDADDLSELTAGNRNLLFLRSGPYYDGRPSSVKDSVIAYDFKERQPKTVVEDVASWSATADGKHVLAQLNSKEFKYVEVGKTDENKSEEGKNVSLAGLMTTCTPAEEWHEIFAEVWRRYRDYFYVENMHGYAWRRLREKYEPQLAFVANRADLNYVIAEMIGELTVQHAYIEGGDMGLPSRPDVALPGARFELDATSGRYRIARIFAGQNEEERYRSPLTEVGVDAEVGDFVIAVNGRELDARSDPYELLQAPRDLPMEWRVSKDPAGKLARTIRFLPLRSETALLYLDWVANNRARVERMSGGRLGYIHIPDMGAGGLREFIKWWYPQVRKQGLIVDVRDNGGGNVSELLIARLAATLRGTRYARDQSAVGTYPRVVQTGPKVAIVNEDTASDGEIFAYQFRRQNIGMLIGKRTWGGSVGIEDHGPLLDGGMVFVPEFGNADENGQWIIEGHGVDPDIVVEEDPVQVAEGHDPQLERAIEELLEVLSKNPGGLPPRPVPPVKTKAN